MSAQMTVTEIEKFMREVYPQMYHISGVQIEHADGKSSRLREPFNDRMIRPGGTVSGPTLMTLADFAIYVALLSAIGPAALAVTTNLNINFLSKAAAGRDVIAEARLMKVGKRLAIGEVNMYSDGVSDLVAHATMTYSIPPKRD